MDEVTTDDNSDELYSSYKSSSKRAYSEAKKRAAEVKVITPSEEILDNFSDSDISDSQSLQPAKKTKLTSKKQNKRGRPSRKKIGVTANQFEDDSISSDHDSMDNLVRKKQNKRGRPTRKKSGATVKRLADNDTISSGDDSMDNLVRAYEPSISRTLRQKRSNVVEIDCEDCDTEPEVNSTLQAKEVVCLSDSSDLEIEDAPEIAKCKIEDSNELMSIKISWRFQPIQKFQLRRHQKFKTLLEHFAKLEGVSIEQVLIHGGKDKWRAIEPYDTPDSIGITIADVLEGGFLLNTTTKHSSHLKRFRDPNEVTSEEIELRVQQEQTRSFPVLIKKNQKMQVVFIKVSEQLEIELDKVKLFIDGEVISPNSTPEDLELDNGDVLDMMMAR